MLSLYRPFASWIMNDATVQHIRKKKDSDGNYIWRPGLVAGAPDTLFGAPVFDDTNMATLATGNATVVYGDLSGYYVRYAGPIRVERTDFAFANDLVSFRFLWRADGDIVDTVGMRKLVQA